MSKIFYNIGSYFSSNPCMGLIICITISSLLSLGMYNVRLETDPQKLWVSEQSRTYKEETAFSENFGPFYRTNQFIFAYKNQVDDGKNIFTKPALQVIYYLQNIINSRTTKKDGKEIQVNDICFKPVSGKGCLAPSPMDIWLQDPRILEVQLQIYYYATQKDDNIQYTTLCIESVDLKQTNIPCSDRNGIPVIKEAVFSGISCETKEHDTQPCDHCWILAKALSVTYLLNNDKFTNDDAQQWELDVFIDTLTSFNSENYDHLKQFYNAEIWPLPTNEQLKPVQIFRLIYFFSIKQFICRKDQCQTNWWWKQAKIFGLLFFHTQLCFYISVLQSVILLMFDIPLGQFPNKIFNGFLLGFGGIFIVAMSMISSVGFVSYLNIGLTMISAEVIPFLLLAIGVDNMFIITQSFQRIKNYSSLSDRMGQAVASVGPSITTAAFCETFAFLVGATTKMPALQTFCLQAAFGVFIDYIFQITTFVGFLTWDQLRKQEKRYDVAFCIKDESSEDVEERQLVKTLVQKHYNPLLSNPICQGIVFLLSAGLLILSIFGLMKLELGLEEQVSMVSESDLYNYFTYEKKYIEVGPPAYVVLEGLDYSKQSDLDMVSTISNSLSQLSETVQPPIYSWVASFKLFIQPSMEWTKSCGTSDIALYDFPIQLKRFVETKITSTCCQQYGICGETFQADIVIGDDGYVKTSRLRFQHRPIHNSDEYILSLEQTRQALDRITKDIPQGQKIFAYSLPYVFYDQYAEIRSIAISNTLLGLATIFLTVTLIQDITCAVIVICGVFLITFNLIGMVWLLNVVFGGFAIQINAISVVNLVICLGLAVEFVVHVTIKFRTSRQASKWERVHEAMTTMGTSVFVGIVSTKLIGVIVLGFAASTLFRLYYFRMYILMVILGAFNGLCVLPIMLGLIGPGISHKRTVSSASIDQNDSKKPNNNS